MKKGSFHLEGLACENDLQPNVLELECGSFRVYKYVLYMFYTIL